MAYTKEQLKEMFQSSFDLQKWTDFIIDFFKAREVYRTPEQIDIDPSEGRGYVLGYLDTSDTYRISFFYLKLNRSIDQRKVGLRQLIDRYIKIDSDAGIGVFDDGKHWRLSFITDLRGEKTSPKRYTFVFGERQNQYLTAIDRFMGLQKKGVSFASIKEAFSVEALTKQFYNDLFNWYTWALKEDTGVYFPNNPNTPTDDRENLDTKIIRLITRLMFVWFIKQKGLVPDALFNPAEVDAWLKDFDPQSMESANYYQGILQNLFFATLNRPIKTESIDKDGNVVIKRRKFAKNQNSPDVKSLYRYIELFKISEDKVLSIFEFIPFINGGLFECLDKNKTQDGVENAYFEDGFSRNSTIKNGRWTRRAFIPNKLFFDPEDGIISIFNRYNFTVEENSPSEQQVALDPELLGKVFENLLGVFNPETNETARKQSGSFYTPREIVNYMVDISLQAYLGNTDEVKSIFADDFVYDNSKRDFYNSVIEKLKTIKVLDPACGSGAFPMGMLNRIVEILQRLNAEGSKYDLKLQIMENCIYGGDIQTIAAQITKLRFFISLVCDCTKNDNPDDNYGIPNLPNLETHFVACDSLISLKKNQQLNLFEMDIMALKERLREVRHEHFMAKTVHQKTKLRNLDKEIRDELAKRLASDSIIDNDDAKLMVEWNPYDQNARAPFFDPEWMFGIKDGFDVVIGNPPYIEAKKLKHISHLLKSFDVYSGTADYSIYFIERGIKLCKPNGSLYYITTNKFFNTGYGMKIRKEILKKNMTYIINFEQVEVFENVLVSSVILGLSNIPAQANGEIHFKQYSKLKFKDFRERFLHITDNKDTYSQNALDENEWSFSDKRNLAIKSKIEKGATQLSLVKGVAIYRGVTTGYNPAFVISNEQRDVFIEEDSRNANIIKNLLQGRNVRKWYYNESNENLLQTGYDLNIKTDYPIIYIHLFQFHQALFERSDQGKNWWNLRACQYYNEFEKPEKIIWGLTADKWAFTLDEKRHYLPSNGYILTSEDVSIKYILGLLNSDLLKYYFSFIGVMTAGGAYTLKAATISALPFKMTKNPQSIIDIVDEILSLKEKDHDADVSALEEQLNNLVYTIYEISQDEQAIIQEKLSLMN